MRKTWKSALSFVLSAAMVLTAGVVSPNVKSDAADDVLFTATLQQNGAIWGWGGSAPAGDTASVEVTGPGDYTLKVTTTNSDGFKNGSGAMWLETDLTALPTGYSVVGKTIKVGDESYDWSKAELMVESGKARLNIWNEWNPAATSHPLGDEVIEGVAGDKVEITFTVVDPTAATPTPTPDDATPTPGDDPTPTPGGDDDKPYTATLAGQTNTDLAQGVGEWDFSAETKFKLGEEATISWDGTSEGKVGAFSGNFIGIDTDLPWQETGLYCKVISVTFDDKEVEGCDYSKIVFDRENAQKNTERISLINKWAGKAELEYGMFPENDDYVFPAFNKLEIKFIIDDKPITEPAGPWFTAQIANNGGFWGWESAGDPTADDIVSVEVNGYGEYTLRATATTDYATDANAVWISTDLTEVPTDYTVVGKTIKFNNESYDWSKADMYKDETNVRLGVWNGWNNSDAAANPLGDNIIEGVAGDIIEMTFEVKANDTATVTPTPVPSPTPKPPVEKVEGPKKDATFTSGSLKYKVTKAATITGTKRTAGAVTVVGLAKKNATSVNVKNTAKSGNASYKVTAVGKKAFQKAAKLKKVTLGTAIKTIPASAFANCKKLTTVKATGAKKIDASAFKGCKALKSVTFAKLSSVKKGAFKGCKKTIKVGGKKAVKKANVKKLKKSGYKKFK